MGRRRPVAACPICGVVEKLTEEDVYPKWLRRSMAEVHALPGNLPDKVIVFICSTCNGRMAQVFEDAAAPILRRMMWSIPQPELTADECLTVGRWMLKTDVMFAFAHIDAGNSRLGPIEREGIRRDLVQMMRDPAYVPPNSMARVFYIDPDQPDAVGRISPRGWIRGGSSGFHMVGILVTDTILRAHSLDFATFLHAARNSENASVLLPLREAWPPSRGIAFGDVGVLRAEVGHGNMPTLGGGWVAEVRL